MDELQKLYDVLTRDGYFSKSFDEFQSKWEDDAYQSKVYGVVKRDGLYSKDEATFKEKYGVKKKATPEVSPEPVVVSGADLQTAQAESESDPQSTLGQIPTEIPEIPESLVRQAVPETKLRDIDDPKDEDLSAIRAKLSETEETLEVWENPLEDQILELPKGDPRMLLYENLMDPTPKKKQEEIDFMKASGYGENRNNANKALKPVFQKHASDWKTFKDIDPKKVKEDIGKSVDALGLDEVKSKQAKVLAEDMFLRAIPDIAEEFGGDASIEKVEGKLHEVYGDKFTEAQDKGLWKGGTNLDWVDSEKTGPASESTDYVKNQLAGRKNLRWHHGKGKGQQNFESMTQAEVDAQYDAGSIYIDESSPEGSFGMSYEVWNNYMEHKKERAPRERGAKSEEYFLATHGEEEGRKILNDIGFKSLSDEQQTVYNYYDRIEKAAAAGYDPEKLEQLREVVDRLAGSNQKIYDPSTGEYIDKSEADEYLVDWDTRSNESALQLSQENGKEDLTKMRDRAYFELKYLEENHQKNYGGGVEVGDRESPIFKARARYNNLNRALMLNESTTGIGRSAWARFGESFLEGFGGDFKTDEDYVKAYPEAINYYGGHLSDAEKERAKSTWSENVASAAGGSIPSMLAIAVTGIITEGVGIPALIGDVFAGAKAATKYKSVKTLLGIVEKGLAREVTYELAGQGVGTGFGEGVGAAVYDITKIDELLATSKSGKFIKTVMSTFFRQMSRATGEVVEEYSGQFINELAASGNFGDALDATIGAEPMEKLALTYIIAGTFGSSAFRTDYKAAKKSMEQKILKYEGENPVVKEVKKSIQEEQTEGLVKSLREKAVELGSKDEAPSMEAVATAVEAGELELPESVTKAGETLAMVDGKLTKEEKTQVKADIDETVKALEAKGDPESLKQIAELKKFSTYIDKSPEDVLGKQTKAEAVVEEEAPVDETVEEAPIKERIEGETKSLEEEFDRLGEEADAETDKKKQDEIYDRYFAIEDELNQRETELVFQTPIEELGQVLDDLKEKKDETFTDPKDIRESKEVVDKYTGDKSLISDAELKKDFQAGLRGRPTTWYADGLKFREAAKELSNRGITIDELIEDAIKVYTNEGYSREQGEAVVKGLLKPILKGAETVTPVGEIETKTEDTKEAPVVETPVEVPPKKKGSKLPAKLGTTSTLGTQARSYTDKGLSKDSNAPDSRTPWARENKSPNKNGETASITLKKDDAYAEDNKPSVMVSVSGPETATVGRSAAAGVKISTNTLAEAKALEPVLKRNFDAWLKKNAEFNENGEMTTNLEELTPKIHEFAKKFEAQYASKVAEKAKTKPEVKKEAPVSRSYYVHQNDKTGLYEVIDNTDPVNQPVVKTYKTELGAQNHISKLKADEKAQAKAPAKAEPEVKKEAPVEEKAEPTVEETTPEQQQAERAKEIDQEATAEEKEDVKIADDEMDYAESQIENLQEEIVAEKGNLKEELKELRDKKSEIRKDKSLSADQKTDAIEDINAEIEDAKDEHSSLVGTYKDDIKVHKSDMKSSKKDKAKIEKKINARIAKKKAEAPVEEAPVEKTLPEVSEEADAIYDQIIDRYMEHGLTEEQAEELALFGEKIKDINPELAKVYSYVKGIDEGISDLHKRHEAAVKKQMSLEKEASDVTLDEIVKVFKSTGFKGRALKAAIDYVKGSMDTLSWAEFKNKVKNNDFAELKRQLILSEYKKRDPEGFRGIDTIDQVPSELVDAVSTMVDQAVLNIQEKMVPELTEGKKPTPVEEAPTKKGEPEMDPADRLEKIASDLQAGRVMPLADIQFAKEYGIDLTKPLDKQIEKALEEHKNNLKEGPGPVMMVSFSAIKSAAKLVRLYTIKGVRNFREFLRRSKLKFSNWLSRLYHGLRSKAGRRDTQWGYRNLNSRMSLDSALEAVTMLNQEAQKFKDATTEEEMKEAKKKLLERLHEVIMFQDIQLLSVKNRQAKAELEQAKLASLNLFATIKKGTPAEIAEKLNVERTNIIEATEAEWKMKEYGVVNWFLQIFQDKARPQKLIEEQIRKQTESDIPISESAYELQDLALGMTEDQNRRIEEYLYGSKRKGALTKESLVYRMKQKGISEDQLGLFMYALHAPERNKRMKKLTEIENAEYNEKMLARTDIDAEKKARYIAKNLKDNPISESNSGMTNEDAADFIAEAEKEGKLEDMTAFAKEFKENVTDKIAENLYKGGIITEEQYKNLINGIDEKTGVKFDFYVPLKVEGGIYNDLFAEDSRKGYNKETGKHNTTTKGGVFKPRKTVEQLSGRSQGHRIKHYHRNSPFHQAVQDLYATSALVHRNKANQALHKMAKENPNKEVWGIEHNHPYTKDDGTKGFHQVSESSVPVYIDGTTHYVVLKTRALKEAYANRRKLPVWSHISWAMNKYNSYLRNILTIYNPEFGVINKVRDMQDAMFNLSEHDSRRVITKFRNYTFKSMGAVVKFELGSDSEGAKLMEEMMAHGGFVSWANYDNVSSVVQDINKASRDFHKRTNKYRYVNPLTLSRKMVRGVDIFNATMEQSTRVAIYRAVRDVKIENLRNENPAYKGKTIEQIAEIDPGAVRDIKLEAASASKNVTINFNKKGIIGSTLNTLYLFSNAGIQAAVKPFQVIGKKGAKYPKRLAVAAFLGGMGYKAMLNSLLDDDEWAELLTDYDFEQNIIIPLPGIKGKYISIPKSYGGFRFLWNMGQSFGDAANGDGGPGTVMSTMSKELMNILNPVSGGYDGSVAASFTPTIGKPMVELETNLNYAGQQILPHSYSRLTPDYKISKSSTPEGYKAFAEGAYNLLGIDAHPDTYKHWFGSVTGGIYQTGIRTFAPIIEGVAPSFGLKSKLEMLYGDKYSKGGAVENIPLVRRLFIDTKNSKNRVTGKVYTEFEKAKEPHKLTTDNKKNFYKYLKMSYEKGLIDGDRLRRMGSEYSEVTGSFDLYDKMYETLKEPGGSGSNK